MLWWIAALAPVALAAFFAFRRNWIVPWAQLRRLVAQIAQGQRPPTFLVSGNRDAWQIGVMLEDLLLRRQQLEQRLSEESAEMRAIFAALTDALVVLDRAQHVRFCNPAFEQLVGGRPVALGTPLPEILRDIDAVQTISKAYEERAARSFEVNRLDKYYQLVAMPITDRGEDPTGIVAIFHDISRLKQTDEIRRDFVANVSHELRTPLSIFRGNLEALLDDENLSREESRHIFSVMKRHSDRLNRLIEDLLALVRLEAKETTLQLAPLDVGTFVNRVARDWSKRLEKKNLKIEVQADEKLPSLTADEFRLEQVMHNLLENAMNYSSEGHKICIRATAANERLVLSVVDEGAGITPADLPRIFERFYRADKARSRERGSTGLGLSIVKHIAQLHGGDVQAESEVGKGTTVSVLLPWEANCLRNCNKAAMRS